MPATGSLTAPEFLAKLDHLARIARKVFSGERGTERGGKGKRGSGTLFQEHRSYTPGDDPRTVDWNIYGRLGELFVKVFEPEEKSSLTIFLDQSRSMRKGRKGRLALEIAAAFGYIGLVHLDGVRLVPFPSSVGSDFHGQGEVMSYLQAIEKLRPEGDEDLDRAVYRASVRRRTRALTMLLSDFFPIEPLERALHRMLRERILCVHLIDPREVEPSWRGPTRLEDWESRRRRWIGVTPAIRERYRSLVQAHLREVSFLAGQNGASYIRVPAGVPFDAAVMRILMEGKA